PFPLKACRPYTFADAGGGGFAPRASRGVLKKLWLHRVRTATRLSFGRAGYGGCDERADREVDYHGGGGGDRRLLAVDAERQCRHAIRRRVGRERAAHAGGRCAQVRHVLDEPLER